MRPLVLWAMALCALACAVPGGGRPPRRPPAPPPDVQVRFKGQQLLASTGRRSWRVEGVRKDEMIWSPDGNRFAYVRPLGKAADPPRLRVIVRNLAGDPVGDFAIYRPGAPAGVEWIDDRRIGYLAPRDPSGPAYVIHSVDDGEILAVRRGAGFQWSAGKRHLAYIWGSSARQSVMVDGRPVYPRAGVTRLHGPITWSPDGTGLAFVEEPRRGTFRLVVVLDPRDEQGDLTWPLPLEAVTPGQHVFWAGTTRILIGESELKPHFAAGWERFD